MCTIKINYYLKFKNFLDEVYLHDYGSREHKHKSIDKQVTRLLVVYFVPSNNAEDVFLKDEKDESVFFFKVLCFFIIISRILTSNSFWLLPKTPQKGSQKTISRKKNNSRRILQNNVTRMATLENFKDFPKTAHLFFREKPDFRMF